MCMSRRDAWLPSFLKVLASARRSYHVSVAPAQGMPFTLAWRQIAKDLGPADAWVGLAVASTAEITTQPCNSDFWTAIWIAKKNGSRYWTGSLSH